MNETEWAIRNLELAGWCDPKSDYDGMIGAAVKNLLLTHQREGHSGMSHQLAVHLFKAVALGEALTMQYWQERFEAYNKLANENGFPPWTEEQFESQVCRKPKEKQETKET